ncbi:MAG: DUF983 domain-containing protein [Thalassobius sp.]|nr:DUF983 domain-containing protein [Thalassovita sp.]
MEVNTTNQTPNHSKVSAIVGLKCPRCREGHMFQHPFLAKPLKFSKMHDKCEHCQQNFHPEPGFYIGAMYFSYAINVAIVITLFVALNIMMDKPILSILLSGTIIPAILMVPINFRISRSLMLHLFGGIDYDPSKS